MKNFLKGNVRLVITYWVFGIIPRFIYRFIETIIEQHVLSLISDPFGKFFIYAFIAFPFIYYPLIFIAIWNSASKYTGNKAWAVLAKIAVVLGIISLIASGYEIYDKMTRSPTSTDNIVEEVSLSNKSLPAMIDQETELVKITFENKVIAYHYRLVNQEQGSMDVTSFVNLMKPRLIKNACENKNIRPFLNDGISVSFNYVDKMSAMIQDFLVTLNDCKMIADQ